MVAAPLITDHQTKPVLILVPTPKQSLGWHFQRHLHETAPRFLSPKRRQQEKPRKMLNYFSSAKRKCQGLPVPWEGALGKGLQKETRTFGLNVFAGPGGSSRAPRLPFPVLRGGFAAEWERIPIYNNDTVFKETFLRFLMRKAENLCRGAIDQVLLNTQSPITSQMTRPARRQRQIMITDEPGAAALRRWRTPFTAPPNSPIHRLPTASSAASLGFDEKNSSIKQPICQ